MTIKVAINGFGRIGRIVYRILADYSDIQVVAVNDLVPPDNLAYLLQHDSVHRTFSRPVSSDENNIFVDDEAIAVYSEKHPNDLPWKKLAIDYVIESSGHFTSQESAEKHLEAGAKRVIISAPAKGSIPTFVMGVNESLYNPATDFIVSNASCTTNCLAPLVKVLLDNFGIEKGLMTTIHAMTASQVTVDGPSKKDWRGGRAAAHNIIPASTGAAKALGLCLPQVQGKISGMAFRVPTLDVSAVDLSVCLTKETSYDDICTVMKQASKGPMKGILAYCDEQVVSSDLIGRCESTIFDALAGIELDSQFFKLVAWYDNEWGYAARVVDLLKYMIKRA